MVKKQKEELQKLLMQVLENSIVTRDLQTTLNLIEKKLDLILEVHSGKLVQHEHRLQQIETLFRHIPQS